MVVEQVVIDQDNNVDITLAIPIDDDSSDLILLNPSPLRPILLQLRLENFHVAVKAGPVVRPGSPPHRLMARPERRYRY